MEKGNKKIKVLMVAAEASPLVKVGGLADVVGSLPMALNNLGCDVRIMIPGYRHISKKKFGFKKIFSNIKLKAGGEEIKFNLWQTKKAIAGVVVYLMEDNKYFVEKSVYRQNKPEDFLFFSLAVLESLSYMDFYPDIIHCHDFHTGLIPAFLKTERFEKIKDIKTLYTIHNLNYQGKTNPEILKIADLTVDSLISLARDARDGDINFMVQGIINADLVNTVSPTYAREVTTKEYGVGVEKIINMNKEKFFGILNGIDIDIFNPQKSKFIKKNYSLKSLNKKIENKIYLQKKLGMEVNPKKPMVGFISRLYSQKGIDLVSQEVIGLPCQFVFLGSGQAKYENYLKKLAHKYPSRISANIVFDEGLAHQIYAASDMLLIPSRFEPCGLIQMIAMHYGTIPVARDTGGLADTINSSLGFKFKNFSTQALKTALKRALNLYYKYPEKWLKLQKNCLKKDFSWGPSAKKYLTLYKKLAIKRKGNKNTKKVKEQKSLD